MASPIRYHQVKIAGEESYIPVDEHDYKAIELALASPAGVVRFKAAGSDDDNSQAFIVPIQNVQHLCIEEVSGVIDLI